MATRRRVGARIGKVLVENLKEKSSTKEEKAKGNDEKLTNLKNAADLVRSTGMKIGFPCICTSLCTANHVFRLSHYTNEKCLEVTEQNLKCLEKILEYNAQHGFYFFRISSQTVPFASHPICTVDWLKHFSPTIRRLGEFIKKNDFRISMHPDQFVLINAKDESIIKKSVAELDYHCRFLDEMQLDASAKIQIHVGGIYGDKKAAMDRFIEHYHTKLNDAIRQRLVIENDDRLFSVQDCLYIHEKTKIPILFDNLHHDCLNNGEPMIEAMKKCFATWPDGQRPLIDYSTQQVGHRVGRHSEHIDEKHFENFARETRHLQFDIMLEIKDKEQSAILAIPYAARGRVTEEKVTIEAADYRYIYENAQRVQAEAEQRKRARSKKKAKAKDEEDEQEEDEEEEEEEEEEKAKPKKRPKTKK